MSRVRGPNSTWALRGTRLLRVALAVLIPLAGAGPARAWKPLTHVFLAEQALADALDDDRVTIFATDYDSGQVKKDASGDPIVIGTYRADATVIDPRGFRTLGKLVDAVCNAKSLEDVPNLFLYRKGGTVTTPRQPEDFDFVRDAIRYELIEPDLLGRICLVRTQISCPFACSFCSYPTSQGDVIKARSQADSSRIV